MAANREVISEEDILWDSQNVADYLLISQRRFRDYYSKKPDFPRSRFGGRRWLRSEVIDWAKNYS